MKTARLRDEAVVAMIPTTAILRALYPATVERCPRQPVQKPPAGLTTAEKLDTGSATVRTTPFSVGYVTRLLCGGYLLSERGQRCPPGSSPPAGLLQLSDRRRQDPDAARLCISTAGEERVVASEPGPLWKRSRS